MRVADSVCPIRLLFAGRDLVLREIPVALNQRQKTVGPWASPAVRAVRLGGLCVVAAAGLMAAGGLVARQPGPGAGGGQAAGGVGAAHARGDSVGRGS